MRYEIKPFEIFVKREKNEIKIRIWKDGKYITTIALIFHLDGDVSLWFDSEKWKRWRETFCLWDLNVKE